MKPKFQKCHFVPVHTKLSFISGAIRKGIGSCAVVHVIMKLSFILSSRGKLQCPFTIDLKYVGEGRRERERSTRMTNKPLREYTHAGFSHRHLQAIWTPLFIPCHPATLRCKQFHSVMCVYPRLFARLLQMQIWCTPPLWREERLSRTGITSISFT